MESSIGHYLSVNKEGLLMVCDERNHRVQVFDELSGKCVKSLEIKVVKVESLGIQYVQQILVMEGLLCVTRITAESS